MAKFFKILIVLEGMAQFVKNAKMRLCLKLDRFELSALSYEKSSQPSFHKAPTKKDAAIFVNMV